MCTQVPQPHPLLQPMRGVKNCPTPDICPGKRAMTNEWFLCNVKMQGYFPDVSLFDIKPLVCVEIGVAVGGNSPQIEKLKSQQKRLMKGPSLQGH